jgi:HEAT repeat protein
MSMVILTELQSEVRRLLIAGSGLAAGDLRLKKLLPPLQKRGESIPVFAKVAEALERVINADSTKNAEQLLELAKLVHAILYTQGQTKIEGELAVLATLEFTLSTDFSYRCLNPVVEALTSKGSGRLEIIREAFEEGLLQDLRLINPLIMALDDKIPDIADLAAKALEKHGQQGQQLVPLLKKGVDFKGGKGQIRRIVLISKISGSREKEFYLEVAEKGSAEVKTSVAEVLKDLPECEAVLLKLSKDRSKKVRAASLYSLAYFDSEAAGQRLCEVFQSKERDSVLLPLKISKVKSITHMLVAEGKKLLQQLLELEEGVYSLSKKKDDVITGFITVLDCMEEKQGSEIIDFLKECCLHVSHLQKLEFYQDERRKKTLIIGELVARSIVCARNREVYELFYSVQDQFDECLFAYAFKAALEVLNPQQIFERYTPYLKKGRHSGEGKTILRTMETLITFASVQYGSESDILRNRGGFAWDSRWLNVLVSLDEIRLVCRLISKNDLEAVEYLQNGLRKIKQTNELNKLYDIIRGLLQAEYPDVLNVIMSVMKELFMKQSIFAAKFNKFAPVLLFLPPQNADALEKFAMENKDINKIIAAKVLEMAQQLRKKGNLVAASQN